MKASRTFSGNFTVLFLAGVVFGLCVLRVLNQLLKISKLIVNQNYKESHLFGGTLTIILMYTKCNEYFVKSSL